MKRKTKRYLWSITAFLLTAVLTYFIAIGYLIPGFEEMFNLKVEDTNIIHIELMWILIISCILISLNICLLINIFKKLKDFKEGGLIWWSFILSLTVFFFGGFIGDLYGNLIEGLIGGVIGGIFTFLIVGLIKEFD